MEWRYEREPQRFVWLPGRQTAINLDHIVGVEFNAGPNAIVLTTRTGTAFASLTITHAEDVAALREALGLAVKS